MEFIQRIYSGRLNRRNFLIGVIIMSILAAILQLFSNDPNNNAGVLVVVVLLIVVIVFLILYFSLLVRRLHDLGISGWWSLINFIPLVNLILLIFLLSKSGEEKANRFGPKPKPSLSFPQDLLPIR